VIWDQDVRVIVMLTAEKERGLLKCHTYWAGREFGPLKLKLVTEVKRSIDPKMHRVPKGHQASGRSRAATNSDKAPPSPTTETPHVIVRTFMLAHTAHPFSPQREITQIHWSDWPDFGAPASPAQVLGLIELSNMYQRKHIAPTKSSRSDDPESDEASRPMLVHCSAGCGRTGTFCTIDTVLDMLKRQRKEASSGTTPMETGPSSGADYSSSKGVSGDWIFDQDLDLVEKTVVDFRGQRLSMVQSLSQYVLCYETVLEWISQQNSGSRTDEDQNGSGRGVDSEKS
jgi:protein-tyrosine phosphatase